MSEFERHPHFHAERPTGHEQLIPEAVNKNLFAVYEAERENGDTQIPVFRNEKQIGSLYHTDGTGEVFLPEQAAQQTLNIIRGEACFRIDNQEHDVREGHIIVVPSEQTVSFSDAREDFLAFDLTSPNVRQDHENPDETVLASEIVVANLFDLYASGERVPFMSTTVSKGDTEAPSAVDEVEVFFPEMTEAGYALDGTQAGRLLIYEEPVSLDKHVHPHAQHAIYVLKGHGSVEFEGEQFDLTPGGLFVVPPNTRHQLGSYGDFLAFVVNSPGIPPSHHEYSFPVE